jgi:nitrogen regulatory protein P-II 2
LPCTKTAQIAYLRPLIGQQPGFAAAACQKDEHAHREEWMKYVIAVIKPNRLDDVRKALAEIGVKGMTLSEAKGYGRQKGHTEIYRGAEYQIDFVPKAKIELAIDDVLLPVVVETIQRTARTGKIGDGKIFVLDLDETIRIRTGETGSDAL